MTLYKYILLDWDGNLAKTIDVWMQSTRRPFVKRGISVSDAQIATHCFGRPHEGFTELGIYDVEQAIEEMDNFAKKLMPEVELYPDAPYVLEELKKLNTKIALVTSSKRNNVIPIIDKYDLNHFFDAIVAFEDTNNHKPNPEPLQKALEMLGGDADKSVMIGDSDKDINAAKNAGIDSILFFPEEHSTIYSKDDMESLRPTYIVDDFRKVVSIITG